MQLGCAIVLYELRQKNGFKEAKNGQKTINFHFFEKKMVFHVG